MKPQDLRAAGFQPLNPERDVWHLAPFSIPGYEAAQLDDAVVLKRAEDCLLLSLRQVMERKAVLAASRKPLLGNHIPGGGHPLPTVEQVESIRRAVAEAHGVTVGQVVVMVQRPE